MIRHHPFGHHGLAPWAEETSAELAGLLDGAETDTLCCMIASARIILVID
jgi:hypothetical protein